MEYSVDFAMWSTIGSIIGVGAAALLDPDTRPIAAVIAPVLPIIIWSMYLFNQLSS